MEFGNLLDKINHKDTQQHQFLALELTDDIVQAAIWQVTGNTTEVVTAGTPIPWNGDAGDVGELVNAVDTTITKAVETLETLETTPTQVIFGVPTTWLDGATINASKKPLIKQICTDLELSPLGFVVIMDSLVQFLRMQEGTPATAILIQVADTELTIASVVLGKTHKTINLPRTDDVAKDVEVGLTHCVNGLSQLPSRFIVFDGMHDLGEVVQNLTLVDWQSKFPFIHIPKIEALKQDIVIKSLCVAGGGEVARAIGFDIKPIEELPTPDIESLGFSTIDDTPASDLEEEAPAPSSPRPKLTLPKLSIPKLNLPHLHNVPLWSIGVVVALAALFFALSASLWLFPKATVTIAVAPRVESAEFTLKLDPQATALQEDSFTVPVQEVEASITDTGTITTTGTKLIGDPSIGEVTLYNRTSQKKSFPKGTVISAGSLKFTLDSEVTVASKSAGSDYVDVPGKATVQVTASAIGDSGNLKAGTEFVVATFSQDSYIAKNEAALKGGSSQNIAAVSAQDKANLLEELVNKIGDAAKQKLQSSTDLVYILTDSSEITDEEYSAKVGAESKTLEATITLNVKGYSLSRADAAVFAGKVLSQKLEGQFELVQEPSLAVQGGDKESLNIKAEASVLPRYNSATLKSSLSGLKTATEIEAVASTIPGFTSVKAVITPSWLPPKLKSLPRKPENISLFVVQAE